MEQVTVLVVEPLQSFPPFAGAGLEQERVSTLVPSPQETEQAPATKSENPPSTEIDRSRS